MLQTIEVKIDSGGHIESIEVLTLPSGRALLTLLPATEEPPPASTDVGDVPPLSSLFGIIKAQRSARCDEINVAVRRRAIERFHDRD